MNCIAKFDDSYFPLLINMHTHSDYFGYVHSILTMLKHSTNYDRVQPSQPFFSAIYCSFILAKSNRSSRPGVKSATESTQPQINSAGSSQLWLCGLRYFDDDYCCLFQCSRMFLSACFVVLVYFSCHNFNSVFKTNVFKL